MISQTTKILWWLSLPCFLLFAFMFPRVLITYLGPANPWTNYLYIYVFGFFYTGSGIALALSTGACNLSRPRDRHWLKFIIGGFLFFAFLQAIWIYFSLTIPYLGGRP